MPNEFIARNGIIALNNSTITGSLNVSGNITTPGTITAQTLVVQTVTSSVSWITGSTKFGSTTANTHQFTGSILQSGSLATFAGNVGIGTTNPTSILYVFSSNALISRFDGSSIASNSATEIDVLGPQSNGELNLGVGGSTFTDSTNNIQNKAFITAASGLSGLNLRSDAGFVQITAGGVAASNEVARFTSGGSVGIGTISPSSKLHVYQTGDTTMYLQDAGGVLRLLTTGGANYIQSGTSITGGSSAPLVFGNIFGVAEWMRINTSGNVGIGTTNPTVKLQVNGTGGSFAGTSDVLAGFKETGTNTNAYIAIDNSTAGYDSGIRLATNGTLQWTILNAKSVSPNALWFYDSLNSSARLVITQGGNVGIGTTNPTSLLHAVASSVNVAYFNRTTTDGDIMALAVGGTNAFVFNTSSGVRNIQAPGAVDLTMYTNSSERMRITSGGVVSIATTSPYTSLSTRLYVGYDQNSSVAVRDEFISVGAAGGSTNIAGVNFLIYNGGYGGRIFTDDRDGSYRGLVFDVLQNGTFYTAMSITRTTSPNIGIGTTAPSQKLHLHDGDFAITSTYSSGNNDILFSGGSTTGGATNTTARIRNVSTAPGGAATGDLLFTVNSGDTFVNALYIATNGYVGIGTTSPGRNLTVATSGESYVSVTGGASSDVGYLFGTSASDAKGRLIYNNADNMQFWTNSTERMRINSGGNVGIGTTSPSTKFHIYGSSNDIGTRMTNTTASKTYMTYVDTSGNYIVYDATTDNNRIVVLTGGNVGIGTTPSYKLDINGITRFQDIVRFKTNSWNLSDDGFNRFYFAGSGRTYFGSGNGYEWRSDADSALMVLLNGGSVGIGTTSPDAKLDVRSSGLDTNVLSIYGTTGGAKMFDFRDDSASGTTAAMFRMYNSSGTETVRLFPGTVSAHHSWILPSGNFGIGTTSPAYKLDVKGTGYFDGPIYVGTTSNRNYFSRGDIRLTDASSNVYVLDISVSSTSGYISTNYYGGGANMPLVLQSYGNNNQLYLATSGNVGIGTTSPVQKLTVNGSIGAINSGVDGTFADAFIGVYSGNNNEQNAIQTSVSSVAESSGFRFQASNGGGSSGRTSVVDFRRDRALFYTNVGIGTTAPGYKLQVNGNAYFSDNVTAKGTGNYTTIIVDNSSSATIGGGYFSVYSFGAFRGLFGTTGAAAGNGDKNVSIFAEGGSGMGAINFHVNGSGTASHIMTAGGNVGIGTTSPSYKLDVLGNTRVYGSSGNDVSFILQSQGSSAPYLILNGSLTSYNLLRFQYAGTDYAGIGAFNSDITSALSFYTNGISSERMRITSGGNVGIGTTNPGYKLEVSGDIRGTAISLSSTAPIQLTGNNNTATYTQTQIYANQNNTSNNTANGIFIERGRLSDSPSAEIRSFVVGDRGGGIQLLLDKDGKLTVTNDVVAYGSPSDISLKTNIKPLEGALEKIMKLQGVSFTWKENTSENNLIGIKDDLGFIAQQVQDVLPDLVRKNDNGLLSLRDKGIIPVLVEAIKELKAEIDILKQK
jgi:hypothetical protein